MGQKVIVLMGSKSDLEYAERIRSGLSAYSIPCDLRIASAHRNPEYLLEILSDYASSGDQIVAITVAGLSDALSGVVAAQRLFPVIACPPDLEKYQERKMFSSAYTPSDVPVAFVNDPSKAAHFAAQIFSLTNAALAKSIQKMVLEKRAKMKLDDSELKGST